MAPQPGATSVNGHPLDSRVAPDHGPPLDRSRDGLVASHSCDRLRTFSLDGERWRARQGYRLGAGRHGAGRRVGVVPPIRPPGATVRPQASARRRGRRRSRAGGASRDDRAAAGWRGSESRRDRLVHPRNEPDARGLGGAEDATSRESHCALPCTGTLRRASGRVWRHRGRGALPARAHRARPQSARPDVLRREERQARLPRTSG